MTTGLYDKYTVTRTDGEPVGRCFVLELDRDPRAAVALMAYTEATLARANESLDWAERCEGEVRESLQNTDISDLTHQDIFDILMNLKTAFGCSEQAKRDLALVDDLMNLVEGLLNA